MSQGDRIKEARKAAGLTQGQLAKLCGVSRASIVQWESGDIKNLKAGNMAALSKATGYNFQYLVRGTGPKQTESNPMRHGVMEEPPVFSMSAGNDNNERTSGNKRSSPGFLLPDIGDHEIVTPEERELLETFRKLKKSGKYAVLTTAFKEEEKLKD